MDKQYYVYRWIDAENEIVIYVGQGKNDRYKKISNRNILFKQYIKTTNAIQKYVSLA